MKILITGGAGFIGVNVANRFADDHEVLIVDDLSRDGAEKNLQWIQDQKNVGFAKVDIRNFERLESTIKDFQPDAVYHLAAQVAVTTSVVDPRYDFEVNALGTFNVLESVRQHCPKALVAYASTNKVYGGMEDVAIVNTGSRYAYENLPEGVSEQRILDFHSPYGCSKGAADQYIIDYARIYNMNTVSFRQSCIYGTRQFGVEDQGWVAWFTIASHFEKSITLYGDGQQVRDVLWIEDLVDLYEMALHKKSDLKGHAFNVGGGPENTLSLLELLDILGNEFGRKIEFGFDDWRPGDQRVYISSINKAKKFFGWAPKMKPEKGVAELKKWVVANEHLFTENRLVKKAS
ncbi:MAG: GDP-mannose 4,6-dehydratase [Pseudomonadota bacterium]